MTTQKENEVCYIKSVEFLYNYCWKGKTREQIIQEMELVDYEIEYLDQAMEELKKENLYNGWDLDRRILFLIDMEEEDDFDENDVLYMNQIAIHLNGKQFILEETSVAELFSLMDQEKIERYLGTLGQNLQDFVKELKRASAEINR
ncbi:MULTISPECIES: hypothetical protein [Bacillus cereus group]|uniref:hypothetical protein n=1 Tax=Bacillus cereus group TaxID=86661 RepID=UPI00186A6652|nr:hypothetical protein [Bacillus thuringiensis]